MASPLLNPVSSNGLTLTQEDILDALLMNKQQEYLSRYAQTGNLNGLSVRDIGAAIQRRNGRVYLSSMLTNRCNALVCTGHLKLVTPANRTSTAPPCFKLTKDGGRVARTLNR